ncbi:MAG: glycoside hydrolase family 130 protein, partial [Chloroflexota bacterium]
GQSKVGEETRPFQLHRLGTLMRPEPENPYEVGGVLNPGGVRAPNGEYLLFPRLVALGNYSRIGVAKVHFDDAGTPIGVERLGIALEPRELYELNEWSGGGCEDARVTYVEPLGVYVMTYAAFGPLGPRAAMAISHDLVTWTRLGLVEFAPFGGVDMNAYCNKDHLLFPEPIMDPEGRPSIGLIHRPSYEFWKGEYLRQRQSLPPPPNLEDPRWSIWISYCPLEDADWANPQPGGAVRAPVFGQHRLLMAPREQWEWERIGAGTPPIRLAGGWFMIYHGVEAIRAPGGWDSNRYTAGALLLDAQDPRRVLYRSPRPILEPELYEERFGVVDNVVFPTAVDRHETYLDVYYGMADGYIGAARMDIPVP